MAHSIKHLGCCIYQHILTFTKQFGNLHFLNNKLLRPIQILHFLATHISALFVLQVFLSRSPCTFIFTRTKNNMFCIFDSCLLQRMLFRFIPLDFKYASSNDQMVTMTTKSRVHILAGSCHSFPQCRTHILRLIQYLKINLRTAHVAIYGKI